MSKKHKRITVEDIRNIQRPPSPSLSPDASPVCVAVSQYDMEAHNGGTHLWRTTFGGDGRALTQCGENDR